MTSEVDEYEELFRYVRSKVDARQLEHCKDCREPMYLIYKRADGKRTRDYCFHCTKEREILTGNKAQELRLAHAR